MTKHNYLHPITTTAVLMQDHLLIGNHNGAPQWGAMLSYFFFVAAKQLLDPMHSYGAVGVWGLFAPAHRPLIPPPVACPCAVMEGF